jgi:hypothetical protein
MMAGIDKCTQTTKFIQYRVVGDKTLNEAHAEWKASRPSRSDRGRQHHKKDLPTEPAGVNLWSIPFGGVK